jgi:large subunit ribosomal protein L30
LSFLEVGVAKQSATIRVRQTGSPIRRKLDQRQSLIGLGLNRIGRISEVPDTPATRGLIAKVRHLVEVIADGEGDRR